MDGRRFDALARSVHSRRGVIRTLVGLAAGVGLGRGVEAAAGSCLAAGSTCDPANAGACCSNRCLPSKKHKSVFRCAPAGAPFGCVKQDSACRAKATTPAHCPEVRPDIPAYCLNDSKGKPLCAHAATCAKCRRDADCAANPAFGPLARCVKKCPGCKKLGLRSSCVVPLVPDNLP